jgi:deferrochelatase/peroxidase EfeB
MAVSRRRFLTASGAAAGAVAVSGAAGFAVGQTTAAPAQPSRPCSGAEPFYCVHQAGIATPQQDRLLFAAFDVCTDARADVTRLLGRWSEAAARLTQGLDVGEPAAALQSPPTDTGEAVGLDPSRLTLTFGFGPGLFGSAGSDRFGLATHRPAALVDLPRFAGDELDPARSDGDLCVQACANDPQVAYHAIRNLARIARGTAVLRWTQEGFGRTSSTTSDQQTPRNLMGFKDGTNNLHSDDAAFAEQVWVGDGGEPAWMIGGSYLVARRIRMLIEVWDRSSLDDQEQTIGRTKDEGAPLGAAHENDPVDLDAAGADGPIIATDAHIRLASQIDTRIHLLRRGYSFTDGVDPRTGQLDAGLFFLAYQRDPREQFIPLQQRLAGGDALNEYIKHVGSAVFAVPPGIADDSHFTGEGLFG